MRELLIKILLCGFALGAQDTGSPDGLMADCPGMNRSTTFSDDTLRSLYVVVVPPNRSFFRRSETRCKLNTNGARCAAKHLNLRKGTVQVIISGYMDASFSPLVKLLSSVYPSRGQNVIIVEIFPILVRTYPVSFSNNEAEMWANSRYTAARVTKPLGNLLGEFMAALTLQGLSPSRLELLGGSLGAHIAYFGATKYRQLTGQKPFKLTALDPAGPCFRNLPNDQRLNPQVAERVDVVHTNIDGFGIADTMGHVDFYVNGGEYQIALLSNFILPCFQLCSHVRAAIYWVLAFNYPDKFIAVQCDTVADARHGNCYNKELKTNILGPKTNFSQPGIYYLSANEKFPYFEGEKGLIKRKYNVNDYLLKAAPDVDLVI